MGYSILISYLAFINIVSFCLMGIDKSKAKRHVWRIPEKTLFGFAIIGGSIDSILGMRFFHHKTKHWYFVWGMPLILLVQILLTVALYHYFG